MPTEVDGAEESAPAPLCGVYRAVVVDDVDPLAKHRLRVEIPMVHGLDALWASACLPPGGSAATPGAGDTVWVAFEAGDPSSPVWLGRA